MGQSGFDHGLNIVWKMYLVYDSTKLEKCRSFFNLEEWFCIAVCVMYKVIFSRLCVSDVKCLTGVCQWHNVEMPKDMT